MFNWENRHDWNIANCDIEQWRRALKHLAMFQAFVADTTISRMTTFVIAGISEPFDQPTFCYVKVEWTSKIEYYDHLTFNVIVFAGASEYLPSADKWLLHIYCILFANTSIERYVLRKQTV